EAPPLGEPLGWIVERCLQKNPAQRYGSTSDLAHDLRRLSVAPTLPSARTDKSVRATWPLALAAAAIAIAIALAIWKRSPSESAQSLQSAIPTPEIAYVFRDEVAVPVALSPNGDALAVYGMNADGIPVIWLYNLRSGTARQIVENAFSVCWSSDGKSIAYFSEGKLKTVPVDGSPGRILCDARPEGTPTWSGDTILYVQYSTPVPGIYRVSATGGKPQLLVGFSRTPLGLPWWPQFLPDGKHFLYVLILMSRENSPGHELLVGSLDGTPPRKVQMAIDSRAVYANGHLLFVRDGTLLAQPFDPDTARLTGEARPVVDHIYYFANTGSAAFTASENGVLAWRLAQGRSRLMWVDRTGVELRQIANAVFSPLGRFSPDGHRYAVGILDPKTGSSDIWIYDLDRDSSERVTFKGHDEVAPVWAPDGRTIYYRTDGNGGPPDIFRLKLGEEGGTLVYSGPGPQEPHDISRDGKWMLFVDHRPAGAADIYALPLDPAGKPRPFAATPFNEQSPRFSPDGHWVAYDSNASGRPEIYVRAFEGSELAARISKDGGTRPRWRDDGKELFFLGPGGRVMSAPMSGGATTGPPRMLFQSADLVEFEPAPGGSRFLVQIEEGTTDPPVHILTNWPARLAGRQ
ncbi:MAG: hypothetical protein M3041_21240, partial [Acidobacteriota bacterium]|nr:hypothetical protein [Acidobacteriota bacterium]